MIKNDLYQCELYCYLNKKVIRNIITEIECKRVAKVFASKILDFNSIAAAEIDAS